MNRFLAVVLIASLTGNVLLLARRYATPIHTSSDAIAREPEASVAAAGASGAGDSRAGESDAAGARVRARSPWSDLANDDPRTLLARLRDAGFSEDDARAVVRARIEQNFEPQRTALLSALHNRPYWKNELGPGRDAGRRGALRQIQRDQDAMLRAVLGETGTEAYSITSSIGASMPAELQSIPLAEEKRQLVSRIVRDYADMTSEVFLDSGAGPQMPWDREKIAYLEAERRRDLAAALTPEELETYDLYASSTALGLRRQLAGFDATEAEFRALVAIESAYKPMSQVDYFRSPVNPSPGSADERREKIKAALGETRYADYERVTDQGFQRAREVAARLNLPAENAAAAYRLGRDMQRRAEELRAGQGMSTDERKAAMAALAREANARLDALLTPVGATAYKDAGGPAWLRTIEARGGLR